jgi:hypothetical protein
LSGLTGGVTLPQKELVWDPKSVKEMPELSIYLYQLEPSPGMMAVTTSFDYVDDDTSLIRAEIPGVEGITSAITCPSTDVRDLCDFLLTEQKDPINFSKFNQHALMLLRDLAYQLTQQGYAVLSPGQPYRLSTGTGVIIDNDLFIGTFDTIEILVNDKLSVLGSPSVASFEFSDAVIKPGINLRGICNLKFIYPVPSQNREYVFEGITSLRIRRERPVRGDARANKLFVRDISVGILDSGTTIPDVPPGRYGNVITARATKKFYDERLGLIGINKEDEAPKPSGRLLRLLGGMASERQRRY